MVMSEPVEVCEFTPDGMRVARNHLKLLRDTEGWTPLPTGLLAEHTYSQPVEPEVYVEERAFASRREAGQYLAEQLGPLGPGVTERPYLWSWLGMFYLERMTQDPTRRMSEYPETAYLVDPARDSRNRSHHRLLMAYEVWTQWGEDAWLLLDEPANAMRHFTLRVVQSPEIFRSKGVVPLMHTLYADEATGGLRRGVLGQNRATAPPGSLPRLIETLNQLSMTYDVYGMTEEQLLPLLPPEFDPFRPAE